MTSAHPEKSRESSDPAPASARGSATTPEILTLPEAAAFLGVSAKTFQRALREGDVPGRKVGREWKFSRAALAEWVGAGRSGDFLDASDGAAESRPGRRSDAKQGGRRRRSPRREDLRAEED